VQLDLLYRKVVWTYPPPTRSSARNPMRVRADDGLDYMLKDDGGAPIRAREWICHRLADCAGIPVVEYKPILAPSGRVLFGSRVVLNGGPGGAAYNLLSGSLVLAEASVILSGVYVVDLFLGNGDRHADNFVVENDGGALPRIRIIDFSEATALIDPNNRTNIPHPGSSTVSVARALRNHYQFSGPATGPIVGAPGTLYAACLARWAKCSLQRRAWLHFPCVCG
jgi:hypothetical protein